MVSPPPTIDTAPPAVALCTASAIFRLEVENCATSCMPRQRHERIRRNKDVRTLLPIGSIEQGTSDSDIFLLNERRADCVSLGGDAGIGNRSANQNVVSTLEERFNDRQFRFDLGAA